ncbi:MAG: 4-phosphoerythronate dehydrogenase [Bacteroidota bacterium]
MSDKQSPKITVDRDIPFIRGVLEDYAQMHYLPGTAICHDTIKDADGLIIRTRTKCNKTLLVGASVKFVASATTGKDHVDEAYCENAGIRFVHAPGCNAGSVKQYVAAALSVILKKMPGSAKKLTLGIIGAGQIGSRVSKLAAELGFRVLINDPPRERKEGREGFSSLTEVLEASDIVTIHVPLSYQGQDATYHMINDDFLKNMKPGSFLINSSRGEVADTAALIKHADRLNYVIDVWENEPDIDLDLLKNTFLATPHVAGYSIDGKANASKTVIRETADFFGFSLKDWKPELPQPVDETILANDWATKCNIYDVILQTYDICEDDQKLRNQPGSFEELRNEYPVRWEFEHYRVDTLQPHCKSLFNKLGFKK